jgi:hypothetical protein
VGSFPAQNRSLTLLAVIFVTTGKLPNAIHYFLFTTDKVNITQVHWRRLLSGIIAMTVTNHRILVFLGRAKEVTGRTDQGLLPDRSLDDPPKGDQLLLFGVIIVLNDT